jgi:hypothetical protein
VIVTNANGCSKTSAGVKTTVNCREDGSTIDGDFTGVVSVYPNPTNGVFSVVYTNESAVDQDATIQIADMAGRILFEESTMIMNGRLQADWDLTSVLSTGVYFVRINTAEGSMVNKVIVE